MELIMDTIRNVNAIRALIRASKDSGEGVTFLNDTHPSNNVLLYHGAFTIYDIETATSKILSPLDALYVFIVEASRMMISTEEEMSRNV